MKVKFIASEDSLNSFDYDGPEVSDEELTKVLEEQFPELFDIKIIEVESA